jgi:hypothetical protein
VIFRLVSWESRSLNICFKTPNKTPCYIHTQPKKKHKSRQSIAERVKTHRRLYGRLTTDHYQSRSSSRQTYSSRRGRQSTVPEKNSVISLESIGASGATHSIPKHNTGPISHYLPVQQRKSTRSNLPLHSTMTQCLQTIDFELQSPAAMPLPTYVGPASQPDSKLGRL